ncbi:MAG: hypothetical protein AMK69_10320 [Nitrospira bacterium SG8_3]|nr:MAG: hypothetical protein AMK69_10320 [Nitrospira bacterium SG8_3]
MNRKNLPGILLIGLICLSFIHSTYNHVKFVYDGDTFLLETGGKVRYLGINPPESEQVHRRWFHQRRRAGVWWTMLE